MNLKVLFYTGKYYLGTGYRAPPLSSLYLLIGTYVFIFFFGIFFWLNKL